MKKTIKRILLGLVIIILIPIVFVAIYLIRAKAEIKTMSSIETSELVDNLFSIQDSFSNIYIIKDSTQYIVIDAGNDIEVISRELNKLKIKSEQVAAVFLTHTDGDHVAALDLFENAEIYLSTQEEKLLTGEESRFLIFGNRISTDKYSLIDDRQIITIGNTKIQGYLTPGHTFGSMCYLVNNKYLFTGDAIGLKDGKITKFNELFNTDTETAIKSIDIIAEIPEAEYIFTAHHGFTSNYTEAINNWKKKK